MLKPICAALLFVAGLSAQTSAPAVVASTPLVGLVASASSARAIAGIPGAARFAPALSFASAARGVAVPPRQNFILVLKEDGAAVALPSSRDFALGSADPLPSTTIEGSAGCGDVTAFSPAGSAYALYCKEIPAVQIFAGLPSNPHVVTTLAKDSLPADPITALAISDDGEALAALTASGAAFKIEPGLASLLDKDLLASAFAFVPGSKDLVIADKARSEVRLFPAAGAARLLVKAGEGPAAISALAATESAADVFLFSADPAELWRYTSDALTKLDLPAPPERLQALADPGVFLFSMTPGQPAWILQTLSGKIKTTPVPAAPLAQ